MTGPTSTPQAQAAGEQLGAAKREFPPSSRAIYALLVILGVFVVLFGIVFFATVVAGGDPNLAGVCLGAIVLCVAIALVLIGSLFRPRLRVVEHEKGLALYRRKELLALVPWDQVAHVTQAASRATYNGVPTPTNYRYSIQTTDGRSFVFDNRFNGPAHVKDLGQALQQATFPLILARYQVAFNAGQPIQFGKLSLSQAGLSSGNATIPWSEVSGARVYNGRIYVHKSGRWLAWANQYVAKTPDALVLIILLNQLTGQRSQ